MSQSDKPDSSLPKLPDEKDIAKLPRWAQVAFAARCARRVLPLFKYDWPDAPEKHVQAVENAVHLAEDSAAHAYSAGVAADDAADDASDAAYAAYDARAADAYDSYDAAYATSYAAHAAAYDAATAAAAATAATAAARVRAGTLFAIVSDYARLVDRAHEEQWTDDTPVPPAVFGALWPDGPPPGWPAEGESSRTPPPLAFAIISNPSVLTDAEYSQLIGLLGDLVRARGGLGVKRLRMQSIGVSALEGAPV